MQNVCDENSVTLLLVGRVEVSEAQGGSGGPVIVNRKPIQGFVLLIYLFFLSKGFVLLRSLTNR